MYARGSGGTSRSRSLRISLLVTMQIDVLLFASYADAAGAASVRVSVSDDARVAEVVQAVRAAAPAIRLPERPLVAVNHRYAGAEVRVAAADEVALIPPVAGG